MAAKRASTHFVDCDEPKKICLETQVRNVMKLLSEKISMRSQHFFNLKYMGSAMHSEVY